MLAMVLLDNIGHGLDNDFMSLLGEGYAYMNL